jgi:sulfur relay (sulfurtransferase) complex TusBCD TusD component (DsrE family)
MAKYLLIESRDPFDSNDVANYYELATDLLKAGNEVTLFLVQNGVLPARPGKHSQALSRVAKAGAEVLADEFSLRERGISAAKLAPGVSAAPLDVVVDQLAEGRKAIWH